MSLVLKGAQSTRHFHSKRNTRADVAVLVLIIVLYSSEWCCLSFAAASACEDKKYTATQWLRECLNLGIYVGLCSENEDMKKGEMVTEYRV